MIESRGLQHLPDSRIAPVVRNHLRPDLDLEVIVATSERSRDSEVFVPVQQYHVLLQLLEGLIEGCFIVFTLTFTKADCATAVSNEDKYTAMVHSIQSCHVTDTI